MSEVPRRMDVMSEPLSAQKAEKIRLATIKAQEQRELYDTLKLNDNFTVKIENTSDIPDQDITINNIPKFPGTKEVAIKGVKTIFLVGEGQQLSISKTNNPNQISISIGGSAPMDYNIVLTKNYKKTIEPYTSLAKTTKIENSSQPDKTFNDADYKTRTLSLDDGGVGNPNVYVDTALDGLAYQESPVSPKNIQLLKRLPLELKEAIQNRENVGRLLNTLRSHNLRGKDQFTMAIVEAILPLDTSYTATTKQQRYSNGVSKFTNPFTSVSNKIEDNRRYESAVETSLAVLTTLSSYTNNAQILAQLNNEENRLHQISTQKSYQNNADSVNEAEAEDDDFA